MITVGILYASFKNGSEAYEKAGKYFNCYDELTIIKIFPAQKDLFLLKNWLSTDTRPQRTHEIWLNCLYKKN